MRASLRSTARRWARAAALVLICSTVCAGASTKRVLILQSYGRGFEPHSTVSGLFQQQLAETSPDAVEFYEISLVTTAVGEGASESSFVDYLESFDAERRVDLVVAIGGPATQFMQRNRDRMFARTPLLIAGADQRLLKPVKLSEYDAAVPIRVDLLGVLKDLLRVMPETTNIVVVIGASPLERYWVDQIKQDCQAIAGRVNLTFFDDLPFTEILTRAAALPPHTAIFFPMIVADAAGVPHRGDAALEALHRAARAPIFGVFDQQLGKGVVGGRLIPVGEISRQAVDVALKILKGEAPSSLRLPPIGPGVSVFDARELARWRVDESRLPADSTILFRQPTFWDAYKWRLIGVAAFCAGQTVLIAGLLVSRRRRRAADDAVRDLSRRLVLAHEEERTRLARELHDDVTQRLARLAIDVGRIEHGQSGSPGRGSLGEVRDGLARLSDDVHALSYRLHPSLLEDLGLAEALQAEIERFADQSSIPVELAASDFPRAIPNDVSLCLFRVAQEALRNIERHAQARSVKVSLHGVDGGILLTIQDDGVGVDISRAQGRPSLGIASMRERVHIFAGEFEFESRPGRGATVRAFVPLREGRA